MEDQLHSFSTLVTKPRLQLQSTMAMLYKKVLCATKLVVRPYPNCCRTTCLMFTRQKLDQDTCLNASSRQLMAKNILTFKVWRNLMLIPHTIVGASNRLLMISRHNCSIFQKNLCLQVWTLKLGQRISSYLMVPSSQSAMREHSSPKVFSLITRQLKGSPGCKLW